MTAGVPAPTCTPGLAFRLEVGGTCNGDDKQPPDKQPNVWTITASAVASGRRSRGVCDALLATSHAASPIPWRTIAATPIPWPTIAATPRLRSTPPCDSGRGSCDASIAALSVHCLDLWVERQRRTICSHECVQKSQAFGLLLPTL